MLPHHHVTGKSRTPRPLPRSLRQAGSRTTVKLGNTRSGAGFVRDH
jgi:hypothetical protein